jgi:hypothetical protein
MIFTVTSTSGFYSPRHGLLGEEISTPTAESRCMGPGFVFIISLFTFQSCIYFPVKTRIRNASKGGKPNRKPYNPIVS